MFSYNWFCTGANFLQIACRWGFCDFFIIVLVLNVDSRSSGVPLGWTGLQAACVVASRGTCSSSVMGKGEQTSLFTVTNCEWFVLVSRRQLKAGGAGDCRTSLGCTSARRSWNYEKYCGFLQYLLSEFWWSCLLLIRVCWFLFFQAEDNQIIINKWN